MNSCFDVIVIGSGISGMTAAIYLKRANVSVAIIEHTAPGGQLNRINQIDNYPGVLNTDGPTLAYNVFTQMQDLNVPYIYGKVLKVSDLDNKKIVTTDKQEIEAKVVIIATGRKPIETGLEEEKKLIGKGISYCAVCDGALYKDKIVAVYGKDKYALEEATYLSKICSKVYVIGIDKDNAGNIEFKDSKIKAINEINNKIRSIDLEEETLEIDGLFVLLGSYPSCEFINIGKENGYILVSSNMSTNIDGIYACGDVIYKELYQASTAVGEGATAANSAIKYLNREL